MKHNAFVLLSLTAVLFACGCGVTTKRTTTVTPSGSAPAPTAKPLIAKPAGKKPPVLDETSTPKDAAAFAAYYKAHGYTVTQNAQSVSPNGKLLMFHFKASRGAGGNSASVSADVDGATITTSESTKTSD